MSLRTASATAPGLDLYHDGKYAEAYQSFQEDLKKNPDSPVKDKMQFDAGAAAYKMRDYNKAEEAFSQALLTKDKGLQGNSHFNMGRTLEERADMAKTDEDALKDLKNAQTHYEDVLKLDPNNKAAKANLEAVKEKIERLKKKRQEKPSPTPTPPPPKKDDKKQGQQDQEQQSSGQGQQQGGQGQQQNQQQQSQDRQSQNQQGGQKDQEKKDNKSQAKNDQQKKEQPKGGESPTPSPARKKNQPSSPSPGQQKSEQKKESDKGQSEQPSPSPGETGSPSPSPSAGGGEGSEENGTPSPTPSSSPQKKFAGEVKGAPGDKSEKPPETRTRR